MPDSTSKNESVTEIVPKVLGQYLLKNVDGLKDFYDQFPAPNRRISLPSVSVLFQTPDWTPQAVPNPVQKADPADIKSSRFTYQYITGQYDGSIQLDLWAKNKEERDDLTLAVHNALNPNIESMGLVLPMEEYFDVLCSYLYVHHDFEDTEITSQTGEWRTKFDILISCKSVRESKQFVIEDSILDLDTSTTSANDPFVDS